MPPIFIGRLLPAVAAILAALAGLAVTARGAEPLASFSTEKEAQQHCSGGLVVWLDRASKVYYYRGQQQYGATQSGAYVCPNEAKSAGRRPEAASEVLV